MNDQAFDVRHLGLSPIGLGSLPMREPAFEPVGLGAVVQAEPQGYGEAGGNAAHYDLKVFPVGPVGKQPAGTTFHIDGTWIQVYPNNPAGMPPGMDTPTRLPDDIQKAIALPDFLARMPPPGSGRSHYFAISDPHSGAAQTPGEPPGIALLRASYRLDGSIGVAMCVTPATLVIVPPAPYMPPAPLPTAAAAASDNTIWWVLLGLTVVGVGGYLLLE